MNNWFSWKKVVYKAYVLIINLRGEDGIVHHPLLTPEHCPSSGYPSGKNSQSYWLFRLHWFLGNQNYSHRNRLLMAGRNMKTGTEG